MKRFTAAGINYTCKLLDISDNDENVTSIRISSQGSQNMYIWRNGYEKPYALPNNTRVLPELVILKAFKILKGSDFDTKYEPKRKDLISSSASKQNDISNVTAMPTSSHTTVITAPTSSIAMYQVVDSAGNISLFSNANDALKCSLNKTVTITEVFVNVATKPTDITIPIENNVIAPTLQDVAATSVDNIILIEDIEDVEDDTCIKETASKSRRVTRNNASTSRGKGRVKRGKVLVPVEDELDE